MTSENLHTNIDKGTISRATAKLAFWIIATVAILALTRYIIIDVLPSFNINITEYEIYINILLTLLLGYMIVNSFSGVAYQFLKVKYNYSTAASIKSLIKLLGIGALIAGIAGGVSGGAAGVALGGFIGMVVGFASQKILGQALSGLFILITRPFMIGDEINVAGITGVVTDVSTLFTTIKKDDGSLVLIPNNSVVGQKITILIKK